MTYGGHLHLFSAWLTTAAALLAFVMGDYAAAAAVGVFAGVLMWTLPTIPEGPWRA